MFWQLRLNNNKAIHAEKQALQFLKKQGLRLLMRNFACRTGEIDLIMLDDESMVFIEVRFRSTSHFGSASSSIDKKKQSKIRKTAAYYLQKHPQHNHRTCRFDAIAVSNHDSAPKKSLEWIKNAF